MEEREIGSHGVSVVIPTYNRADVLPRAVQSVLNQTIRDLELIVVDDGSSDGTEKVILDFREHDGRIRSIRHEKNRGGNTARNTGLQNARGRYIAFLDSDDEWFPENLEKQLHIFETTACSNPGLVYGGVVIFRNGRIRKTTRPKFRGRVLKPLLQYCFLEGGSNNLILREVFDACGGFDESDALRKGGNQEYEMWIRIARRYDFDFFDGFLSIQHLQDDGITSFKERHPDHAAKSLRHMIDKHRKDYERHPAAHSTKLRLLAKWLFLEKRTLEARHTLLKAIRLRPFTLRSYGFLLFTYLPQEYALSFVRLKRRFLGHTLFRII
jgi:glycosyltransferase involved in cell wall biosynthesis